MNDELSKNLLSTMPIKQRRSIYIDANQLLDYIHELNMNGEFDYENVFSAISEMRDKNMDPLEFAQRELPNWTVEDNSRNMEKPYYGPIKATFNKHTDVVYYIGNSYIQDFVTLCQQAERDTGL